ncbi:MAG: hypothetical protein ACE5F3_04780 [Mariprofundaceae bacterium]
MSKKVKITCPRCKEKYETEKAELYECPKCGTNVRPKKKKVDLEKTQIFET